MIDHWLSVLSLFSPMCFGRNGTSVHYLLVRFTVFAKFGLGDFANLTLGYATGTTIYQALDWREL
jgi:hypothetical protein